MMLSCGQDTDVPQHPDPDQVLISRFPSLYIQNNTPKGRGVFTSTNIDAGTILDVCPVLVFQPEENTEHIAKTQLYHYTYNWPIAGIPKSQVAPSSQAIESVEALRGNKRLVTQALVLGLGSMFNHRSHSNGGPNVGWQRDVENCMVTYFALRTIGAGEELCISYGNRLTFLDIDAVSMQGEENEEAEEMLGRIEVGLEP